MAKEVESTKVVPPTKTWKRHIWDTLDKPPKERRFLLKLDLLLLTFGCLGFFTKFLNQTNLTNAFVSGMREDLNMVNNELNYAMTAFTVGFILGEIPSNILLTRIRPSIYIPALQVVWTSLTLCAAGVTNTTGLYVLRFLIGLAEAGYYPGLQYMIGSWYRKDEIAKRACILNASGSAAMLFSGFLMAAVTNLGGRGGLPGWKWLFIMDGVISMPIAIASFYFLPDMPETTGTRFFTADEIELAKTRMVLEGRKLRAPFTVAKVKKVFTSWHIWLLSLYYIFISGTSGTPIFPQFLKYHVSPKFTVQQINLYPSGVFAVQIVSALVYAWISDTVLRGRRWPILFFGAVVNVITFASLAGWDIPEGWKWACYYLAGQHVGLSGIAFTWANEICSGDTEERAIVLATMNTMVMVVASWLPLIVWQQVEAPQYRKGFITATSMGAVCLIIIPLIKILQDREIAK
ncbi:major facilitator superfamily domain-containing protein [Lasiosphaeria hispida]|uniref:Major facilitator superfamily domain-containing protein n=1 Tax=Lasiosphaeria hispida TaxID=260671 RepID=A0AAJ0HKW5_9PEZI|nr:major facilitator superfamily domain-containing protein [Lasiosphaeria hispida]